MPGHDIADLFVDPEPVLNSLNYDIKTQKIQFIRLYIQTITLNLLDSLPTGVYQTRVKVKSSPRKKYGSVWRGAVAERDHDEFAGIVQAIEFFCCPDQAEMSPEMVMVIANGVYSTLKPGSSSRYGMGFYTAARFIADARKHPSDYNI